MTTDDKIRDEKLKYDISRIAQKYQLYHVEKFRNTNILQVKKYYLLPCNQRQIIGQAKFTYSPLRKAFENQTKTIEEQGKKNRCYYN